MLARDEAPSVRAATSVMLVRRTVVAPVVSEIVLDVDGRTSFLTHAAFDPIPLDVIIGKDMDVSLETCVGVAQSPKAVQQPRWARS